MIEAEFIANEQRKLDVKWCARLRKVERTGRIGRKVGETLLVNGLMVGSPPRPEISNPYNCWRLTEDGRALLDRLSAADA